MDPKCLFCKIVSQEVQTLILFEDSDIIAIMDINPARKGHTLLIPKKHFQIITEVPPDIMGRMFVVAKHISQAMLKTIGARGTSTFIANGTLAGQKAPHFMIHIIPAYGQDGSPLFSIKRNKIPPEDLADLTTRMRVLVHKLMGSEPPSQVSEEKKVSQEQASHDASFVNTVSANLKELSSNNISTSDMSSKQSSVDTHLVDSSRVTIQTPASQPPSHSQDADLDTCEPVSLNPDVTRKKISSNKATPQGSNGRVDPPQTNNTSPELKAEQMSQERTTKKGKVDLDKIADLLG